VRVDDSLARLEGTARDELWSPGRAGLHRAAVAEGFWPGGSALSASDNLKQLLLPALKQATAAATRSGTATHFPAGWPWRHRRQSPELFRSEEIEAGDPSCRPGGAFATQLKTRWPMVKTAMWWAFLSILEGLPPTTALRHWCTRPAVRSWRQRCLPFSEQEAVSTTQSACSGHEKKPMSDGHTYSHSTGCRPPGCAFSTVYGPWADRYMAAEALSAKAMPVRRTESEVFNQGRMGAGFHLHRDIVEGVLRCLTSLPRLRKDSIASAEIQATAQVPTGACSTSATASQGRCSAHALAGGRPWVKGHSTMER